MKSSSIESRMVGETIWLVVHVTQAAIPIAWRLTEEEAKIASAVLEADVRAKAPSGIFVGIFMVIPVTNE